MITHDMIKAADAAYRKAGFGDDQAMLDALTAALALLPGELVCVNALIWEEWNQGQRGWQANTIIGQYQVCYLGEYEEWQLYCPGKSTAWTSCFSRHSSSNAAKIAGKEDYEHRIRSVLSFSYDEREEAEAEDNIALPCGEPEGVVVWYDPTRDLNAMCPRKVIDASIGFLEAAELGTKLYASSVFSTSLDRITTLEEAKKVIEPFANFANVADEVALRRLHLDPEKYLITDDQTVATAGRHGDQSYQEITFGQFRAARAFLLKFEVKS